MTQATLYLGAFLLLVVLGFAGLFLYSWGHRKDKMPSVPPLPKDDDWD